MKLAEALRWVPRTKTPCSGDVLLYACHRVLADADFTLFKQACASGWPLMIMCPRTGWRGRAMTQSRSAARPRRPPLHAAQRRSRSAALVPVGGQEPAKHDTLLDRCREEDNDVPELASRATAELLVHFSQSMQRPLL